MKDYSTCNYSCSNNKYVGMKCKDIQLRISALSLVPVVVGRKKGYWISVMFRMYQKLQSQR